jgi:hypothetical protein
MPQVFPPAVTHRIEKLDALFLHENDGTDPSMFVDHIDGNNSFVQIEEVSTC